MDFIWKYGKKDIEDCFLIRKKVFIEEQGFFDEFDEIDDIAYHLIVLDKDKPIATARIFNEGKGFHCGRICVLKEYRGRNIGQAIMNEIEKKVIELGEKSIQLSAQKRVLEFYEKCGYKKYGDEYLDENCPHIMMKKNLR